MRQVVLDTETTGLSPKDGHRIIEVGCLEMVNRRLTGNKLHFYINPEREIEYAAQKVHGITAEFLQGKPTFKEIQEELLAFLKGAELIIHNAPFDIGFLNAEYKALDAKFPLITHYCTFVDTLVLARQKHPGQKNNLDALCHRYHVDNANRDLHGALLDSELLAQVYLLMTGGQEQLFANQADESARSNQPIKPQRAVRAPNLTLPIIKATTEEVAAHKAFMQTLSDSKQ